MYPPDARYLFPAAAFQCTSSALLVLLLHLPNPIQSNPIQYNPVQYKSGQIPHTNSHSECHPVSFRCHPDAIKTLPPLFNDPYPPFPLPSGPAVIGIASHQAHDAPKTPMHAGRLTTATGVWISWLFVASAASVIFTFSSTLPPLTSTSTSSLLFFANSNSSVVSS